MSKSMWFRRLLGLIPVFILLVPITAESARCPVTPKSSPLRRPDREGEQTRVPVGIYAVDIFQIDDVDQAFRVDFVLTMRWKDPRLAGEKPGRPTCILRLDKVWHPRVVILNRRGLKKEFDDVVEIDPQGNVFYVRRYQGELSVPLDLRDFPFDQQACGS